MKPCPADLDQTPEYFRELCNRIGHGLDWISEHSGISRRRLQYLKIGTRWVNGQIKIVKMSYPEQFVLSSLAEDERDA